MKITYLAGALLIAIPVGAPAFAASVTVDFPSASSTISASGPFFFVTGHSVEETFLDTGITTLQTLDFGLNLLENSLNNGAFVDFDVLVNGFTVGDFTIADGDGLGQFDLSFGFADPDTVADDYTLRFEVTNTVPCCRGSISFDLDNSSATLSDVAPVPLPASLPLLLAGLGIAGWVGRRKARA